MQNLTNAQLFKMIGDKNAIAEIRNRAMALIETMQDHDGSTIYATPDYDLFHEKDENAHEDAILYTIAYLRAESKVFLSDRIFDRIEGEIFGRHTAAIYGCVYHYVNRKEQGYPESLTTTTNFAIENAKFFMPEMEVAEVLHNIDILLNH